MSQIHINDIEYFYYKFQCYMIYDGDNEKVKLKLLNGYTDALHELTEDANELIAINSLALACWSLNKLSNELINCMKALGFAVLY